MLALATASWAVHAETNLAGAREGAKIADASSTLGRDSRADNLIDGDSATTWASAKGKVEDQFVIVRLAGGRAVGIGSVVIDNSVAAGHPAEAALRNFKLAVSTTGKAEEDFYQVKLGSCQLGGGRQAFTFSPARAEYVKIICRSNYGHPDWVEFAEVEVFPAGAPPVGDEGTPSVLLYLAATGTGPFAKLVQALTEVGATVTTFPGETATRSLSARQLLGARVVVVSGEPPPARDDVRALVRFCRRGGGMVCALPRDPEPLQPLLEAVGVTVSPATSADGKIELVEHWVTRGLSVPSLPDPRFTLTLDGAAPLAARGGAEAIALAGEVEGGRLVVVPAQLLTDLPNRDSVELARRAVLWAAAMEDVGPAEAPEPVTLVGDALFLAPPPALPGLTFSRMLAMLGERGLRTRAPRATAGEFSRAALADADLLIAVMPAFDHITALDIAHWVRAGGRLLVLGDAQAEVPDLIRVNEFLREFGAAMALSPGRGLAVAVRRHPATSGITALSRPGEPLGVWCLQGTPLAEMAGTPVAMARTFGEGRVVIMDAGFAVDPVEPEAPRNGKQPPPAYGINLEQNEEFVAHCVAWLSGAD